MWCWCGADVAQQEHGNIKFYASAFRYTSIMLMRYTASSRIMCKLKKNNKIFFNLIKLNNKIYLSGNLNLIVKNFKQPKLLNIKNLHKN